MKGYHWSNFFFERWESDFKIEKYIQNITISNSRINYVSILLWLQTRVTCVALYSFLFCNYCFRVLYLTLFCFPFDLICIYFVFIYTYLISFVNYWKKGRIIHRNQRYQWLTFSVENLVQSIVSMRNLSKLKIKCLIIIPTMQQWLYCFNYIWTYIVVTFYSIVYRHMSRPSLRVVSDFIVMDIEVAKTAS